MIIFQTIPSFADNFFKQESKCMKRVDKNWNKYITIAVAILEKQTYF